MKNTKTALLAVALSASLFAAAGCSSSNDNASGNKTDSGSTSGSTASSSGEMKTEPADGIPASYQGKLPMPELGKDYTNPQPRSNVKDGGTLTLPIAELGPNFNDFNSDGNSVYVADIKDKIAPQLWDYGIDGTPKPNKDYLLSAKVTSEKPMVVTYELNPKAKWNNGDPITWQAFKTTWITQSGNSDKYNPAATDGYSSIKSVEKGKNAKEVKVTFKTPFYPYELLFKNIEHPKNLDAKFYKTGWVNNLHPELEAGPFTVGKLTKDQLTLVRNPKWWGEKSKLDKIVYRQMEDSASINAFVNGEVDATGVATADRLKQARQRDDAQILRGFRTVTGVYIMAKSSPFFKDAQARKAVILGTDRQLRAKISYKGLDWNEEPPGSELMYPFQKGYQDNMADLHYNPDEAKKVLDDAGWKMGSDGYRSKGGVKAQFNYVNFSDDPVTNATARAQQQMMKAIGIKMDIDNRKASDFSTTLTKRNFDLIAMGWSASDPFGYSSSICQLYCSDSESNFSGIGSKAIDKELKKVSTIKDMDEAIKVANDAEKKALHLYGTFPISNGPRMVAVKKGLANYRGSEFGLAGFKTIHAEDLGWQK
ncbi:MAG TPA: ABC transporter family substrate-binding protein [Segeticoccus sp.]|uniref:ABC transporter family substrate-binding protein n=1 Tax=Segeticoccus sp. TaxID=2706531 RepID=UPI002D805E67|nr:ABC transporter family substrate-binding protein [Segeticoccus sp.]HET8599547.1 ABC transporter family substrate-binding protein [Segeticoccus sp.]